MAKMDVETAAATLAALLKTGALVFISAEHVCVPEGKRPRIPQTEAEREACAAYAAEHSHQRFSNPLADPTHFVLEPVTELEGPDERGVMIARTARGSECRGQAGAVLKRLTEASIGG